MGFGLIGVWQVQSDIYSPCMGSLAVQGRVVKVGDGSSHNQVAVGLCLSATCGWRFDQLVGRGGEMWLFGLLDRAFPLFRPCSGGLFWVCDIGIKF